MFVLVYKRKVKNMELTGYPSIDKPWLKYYTEEDLKIESPRKVQCIISRMSYMPEYILYYL